MPAATAVQIPTGTWNVDPAHSSVESGVDDYAEITFESTSITPLDEDTFSIQVSGSLNRGDFDMTFNQALGSGNMMVSDKVTISIDISAVKQS